MIGLEGPATADFAGCIPNVKYWHSLLGIYSASRREFVRYARVPVENCGGRGRVANSLP